MILYRNRWVRYALTVLLLGVVIWRVNPSTVLTSVSSIDPLYLLAALVLTIPFLYLKALRWQVMLRAAGIEASFYQAGVSLVGGMGLALVTPARLGEVVRAAYIRDPRKLKIGGLVMIDKGFDVLVLAGLSIAGAWRLIGPWAGLLLGLATFVGLLLVYLPRHWERLLHLASAKLPWKARLAEVWSSLESLSPPSTSLFLLLTLLAFAVVLLQFAIILLSWRGWSLDIVFFTFPLIVLTNVLPITIGGLGVREGAAALLLAHYGVSPAHAALAAFLMFFLNTALPGIAGAFALPPGGEHSRKPTEASPPTTARVASASGSELNRP